MKDMMALAAERTAKLLGKVLPDAEKDRPDGDAGAQSDQASLKAGGKKEQGND